MVKVILTSTANGYDTLALCGKKKYCLTQVVYRTKLYRLKLLLLHNFLLRRQPQKLEKIMTVKNVWVQLN